MLFYSLMREKLVAADQILTRFEQLEKSPGIGANMMSPLAATLIVPNYKFFERIFKLHKKKGIKFTDLNFIDDLNESESLISFACKTHVRLNGKNKEMESIYQLLIDENIGVERQLEEEKLRVEKKPILSIK